MSTKQWTANEINEAVRAYWMSCLIIAAAELDLFGRMGPTPFTAGDAATKLATDLRGITTLLDALAAVGILDKQVNRYTVPASVARVLTSDGPESQLAMMQHQATCLRKWSHLAEIVKSGHPARRQAGILGDAGEYHAFIEAMDNIARTQAGKFVAELPPLRFQHLLDVGGGSGSYTLAFLQAYPAAKATLFDLPKVIPQARERLTHAGLADRVTLVPGDFYTDPLPHGADLVLISAIVHQNSREQNRALFARCHQALAPGGQILIRDFLMNESRTTPVAGALFAINMLVATDHGGTFTVDELSADLAAAGFTEPHTLRRDDTMFSVLAARKP